MESTPCAAGQWPGRKASAASAGREVVAAVGPRGPLLSAALGPQGVPTRVPSSSREHPPCAAMTHSCGDRPVGSVAPPPSGRGLCTVPTGVCGAGAWGPFLPLQAPPPPLAGGSSEARVSLKLRGGQTRAHDGHTPAGVGVGAPDMGLAWAHGSEDRVLPADYNSVLGASCFVNAATVGLSRVSHAKRRRLVREAGRGRGRRAGGLQVKGYVQGRTHPSELSSWGVRVPEPHDGLDCRAVSHVPPDPRLRGAGPRPGPAESQPGGGPAPRQWDQGQVPGPSQEGAAAAEAGQEAGRADRPEEEQTEGEGEVTQVLPRGLRASFLSRRAGAAGRPWVLLLVASPGGRTRCPREPAGPGRPAPTCTAPPGLRAAWGLWEEGRAFGKGSSRQGEGRGGEGWPGSACWPLVGPGAGGGPGNAVTPPHSRSRPSPGPHFPPSQTPDSSVEFLLPRGTGRPCSLGDVPRPVHCLGLAGLQPFREGDSRAGRRHRGHCPRVTPGGRLALGGGCCRWPQWLRRPHPDPTGREVLL